MDDTLSTSKAILDNVCRTAAAAVYRYVELSGEDPGDDMPESFVSAYVFNQLGTTATLETNIRKLFEWNRDQRARMQSNVDLGEEDIAEVSLSEVLKRLNGRPRVDMVLFQDEEQPKDKQRFLALAEFKRHRIDEWDRNKLLAIMKYIDTCPLGVICSIVDATSDSEWLQRERKRAEDVGDLWFVENVPPLPHSIEKHFASCLRAFGRPSVIR